MENAKSVKEKVMSKDKYIFVIDTDKYAGNFEREMCACLTGQIGQCEVGIEESIKFRKEVGEDMYELMDEIVEQRPDADHGWFRPCGIYPTPGYFGDGWGGSFKDGEEEQAQKHHVEACISYAKSGFGDKKFLKMAEQPFTKSDCNQSVAIYFHKKPSQKVIGLMKLRAMEFLKGVDRIMHDPRTMKISGFRLIKETTTTEEVEA